MRSKISRTTSTLRKIGIALWLAVIAGGIGSYLWDPGAFTAANIAAFLERFENTIWLVYLIFSIFRGFTLLPSSPLVVAGTILFPAQPFAVLTVSLVGIILSSSLIYYFSDHLGFSDFFESHKPELTHRIKQKLEHPLGFLFVAAWAFFPLVPTDLVCYLAGTTRMNFAKFITAVFAGEMTLCVIYIYFGGFLINLWR